MVALLRRVVIIATVATLTVIGLGTVAAADEPDRIAGEHRVDTAIAASQAGWDAAEHVIVATSRDFADPLAAAALAAREDAPLLLTDPDALPASVAAELDRLGPAEVTVIGGTQAVSDAVADQIAGTASAPEVDRIAGPTRFDTAAEIAADLDTDEVIVVSGQNFPDALSATALTIAPESDSAILLTTRDHLWDAAAEFVEQSAAERALVVGGTSAVADAVVSELDGLVPDVARIAGANRYATSAEVAEESLERRGNGVDTPVFATGESFPDAVVASALASRLDGLLVLAHPNQPHEPTDEFLNRYVERWNGAVYVGGNGSLNDDTLASLGRSLRGEEHPEPEPEPEPEPTIGERVVEHARGQLGTPYVYGGSTPSGFDCSGLTSWAWAQEGVTIPRTSSAQFSNLPRVSSDNRRPGDIAAFRNPVGHVGLYIGSGKMIEASRPGVPVRIASVWRNDLRGFVRPAQ